MYEDFEDDEGEETCISQMAGLTIYDDSGDGQIVNTGVLDANGNPILYEIIPEPIGFLVHDENGSLTPRHVLLGW